MYIEYSYNWKINRAETVYLERREVKCKTYETNLWIATTLWGNKGSKRMLWRKSNMAMMLMLALVKEFLNIQVRPETKMSSRLIKMTGKVLSLIMSRIGKQLSKSNKSIHKLPLSMLIWERWTLQTNISKVLMEGKTVE